MRCEDIALGLDGCPIARRALRRLRAPPGDPAKASSRRPGPRRAQQDGPRGRAAWIFLAADLLALSEACPAAKAHDVWEMWKFPDTRPSTALFECGSCSSDANPAAPCPRIFSDALPTAQCIAPATAVTVTSHASDEGACCCRRS